MTPNEQIKSLVRKNRELQNQLIKLQQEVDELKVALATSRWTQEYIRNYWETDSGWRKVGW